MKNHSVLTSPSDILTAAPEAKAAVAITVGISGSGLLLPAATAHTTGSRGQPGSSAYRYPTMNAGWRNATPWNSETDQSKISAVVKGVKVLRNRVPANNEDGSNEDQPQA